MNPEPAPESLTSYDAIADVVLYTRCPAVACPVSGVTLRIRRADHPRLISEVRRRGLRCLVCRRLLRFCAAPVTR